VARAVADALSLPLLASPKDALLERTGYHTLFEWSAATRSAADWVREQTAVERGISRGVSDGGALDLFCFLQRWEWNRMSPERVEALRAEIASVATSYAHVLVTAPRLVGGPAPGRFRNAAHTLQHHRLLTALLGELVPAGRVHALPGADAQAVIEEALTSLR
jgi:hypothetical protein